MARINTLTNFLNDVADSIRAKTGGTADITPANFDTEIASISTGYTPPASSGFANDSWATIAEISEHGLAAQFYNIGDTKTISTINSTDNGGFYKRNWKAKTITVRIVGFNHFKLASDTTKRAGIVLMVYQMPHPSVTPELYNFPGGNGYFGWPGAANMRAWLGNVFYKCLPTSMRGYIKQINTYNYNDYSGVIATMPEYITIASATEFGLSAPGVVQIHAESAVQQPLPGICSSYQKTAQFVATVNDRGLWTRSQSGGGQTLLGVRYDSQLVAGTFSQNTSASVSTTGSTASSGTVTMCILPMFCI